MSTGRAKDGFNYTRESHRISELLQKLGDLKEQFDRGVGVQGLSVSAQALDISVQVLNQALSTGKSTCLAYSVYITTICVSH